MLTISVLFVTHTGLKFWLFFLLGQLSGFRLFNQEKLQSCGQVFTWGKNIEVCGIENKIDHFLKKIIDQGSLFFQLYKINTLDKSIGKLHINYFVTVYSLKLLE